MMRCEFRFFVSQWPICDVIEGQLGFGGVWKSMLEAGRRRDDNGTTFVGRPLAEQSCGRQPQSVYTPVLRNRSP